MLLHGITSFWCGYDVWLSFFVQCIFYSVLIFGFDGLITNHIDESEKIDFISNCLSQYDVTTIFNDELSFY